MEMESTATGMTKNEEVVEFESEGLAFWRNYSRHGKMVTKHGLYYITERSR
jgi:hypothetical protein